MFEKAAQYLFDHFHDVTSFEPAETRLKRKFWNKFLKAEPDQLTQRDWNLAHTLANNWDTCACGSFDGDIPRDDNSSSMPADEELQNLGGEFPNYIGNEDLKGAQRCFRAIQRRSGQVLHQSLFDHHV